ncbi:MAG: N-methyl-L-tryptophan oxidase [Chloroflexota bacterium]|nr:N-methyl-L-tryptophan oxidase [Chloroflexota bacterium]
MTPKTEFEYIVVGLGGLGAAATYWLARRAGSEVLGLEQFELGHANGASGDHSRIIRLSYHQPSYVALAQHAFDHWRRFERETGEPLLVITGDLLLGPRVSVMPITDYMESLATENVQFEHLDADEIMARWPQWRLDADIHASFQPDGGIVPARKAILSLASRAGDLGAIIREHARVTAIVPLVGGVQVVTEEAVYRCRRLVLAVDAWTNQLLAPLDLRLPLTLTQEQVSYFASARPEEFTPDRFPVWIWGDDPNFYGFPVFGEERAVKAAQDMSGRKIKLESRTFEPDAAVVERIATFLRRHLPGAFGPVKYSKTCLYTLTPDRDFVVDTLPGYPQISLALGAGHGFKFAALIGRILCDLAVDDRTEYAIAPFALDRDSLLRPEMPTSFLLRRSIA